MVAITRMYLSQSIKGVLHVHRRQRIQTCHLANMIWPIPTFGTILNKMSNPQKLKVTVLFVWYMFIIWINNICEMPLAACAVVSHYRSHSSPSCYLGRYHIIFGPTSTYDIVLGPASTYSLVCVKLILFFLIQCWNMW
jgi:hypothetical protein